MFSFEAGKEVVICPLISIIVKLFRIDVLLSCSRSLVATLVAVDMFYLRTNNVDTLAKRKIQRLKHSPY